jgi:hypothetical protein
MLEDFQETKDGKLAELAETVRAGADDVGFATFAELLFRHAAAEDLARYGVDALMRIARAAWDKLQLAPGASSSCRRRTSAPRRTRGRTRSPWWRR